MAVVHYPAVDRPEHPVVSVCIANYNGERMLADCIQSVLAQAGSQDVEIIVHDDASTDDSVAWLQRHHPRVELLASESNVGFCASNNRMVAQARGRYVLLLNNDAALFPDAISTLLQAARGNPAPGILTLPQYDWETGDLVDRGCLLDPFYNPVPNLDPSRRDVAYAIGACLWIDRELWHRLGGLPEWMESIGEDVYLCCLARLGGATVRTVSQSGFRHRLGASFGGARLAGRGLDTTLRRRRLSERNKTVALAILTPTAAVWGLLAVHMAALLGEGLLLSLSHRTLRVFREIYGNVPLALLRQRGRICTLRREAQSKRDISIGQYYSAFTIWPRKLVLLARHGLPRIRR